MHQMFSVSYDGGIWKRNSRWSFWICAWGKLGQGNLMMFVMSLFSKKSDIKCSLSTLRRKAGVFKFLRFEERFWKAPFSWRISVDGRPNRRNKAAFSNFYSVHCSVDASWKVDRLGKSKMGTTDRNNSRPYLFPVVVFTLARILGSTILNFSCFLKFLAGCTASCLSKGLLLFEVKQLCIFFSPQSASWFKSSRNPISLAMVTGLLEIVF